MVQRALVSRRVLFQFQLLTGGAGRRWILGAVVRFTFGESLSLCFPTAPCLRSLLISPWHLVVHSGGHTLLGASVWVRLAGLVESLKSVAPRRLAAQALIRPYLSEVGHRNTDVSVTWVGKARGVVGVWDRAGAVESPPDPGQPLLGPPPHWGAVVGPAVEVICQDHAACFVAVHVLRPERGIPASAHLQIEFRYTNNYFRCSKHRYNEVEIRKFLSISKSANIRKWWTMFNSQIETCLSANRV